MSDKNIRNVIKSHIANTKAKREMLYGSGKIEEDMKRAFVFSKPKKKGKKK